MASLTKSQQLVYDYLCSTIGGTCRAALLCVSILRGDRFALHLYGAFPLEIFGGARLYHTRCGPESLHSHCRCICCKAGADSRAR